MRVETFILKAHFFLEIRVESNLGFLTSKFKILSYPAVSFETQIQITPGHAVPTSKLNFSPGRKFPGRFARRVAEPWLGLPQG